MSLFSTGSTAEGTKVGRPDEFDFVLCLDKLNERRYQIFHEII
jgi:hypothetical protein